MRVFLSVLISLASNIFVYQAHSLERDRSTVKAIDADVFARGRLKSTVCQVCHGDAGISTHPSYPNLQGQHVEYMKAALSAYKRRERAGGLAPLMYEQADNLSDKDVNDITYFYSVEGD